MPQHANSQTLRTSSVAVILACLLPAFTNASEPPIVYHEGFETGDTQWTIWAKNVDDPCEVHSAGPTTEKAFAGERSLKLDLTFRDGNYCYWNGPRVKIPSVGDLKLSGYLYVESLPPGLHVGLGRNIIFPPSGHSGCSTIESLSAPTGDWRRFELDLGPSGDQGAKRVLGTSDVYCYVDRIAVMFTGTFKPGQRAVVYVDELKVTGHLPEDYEGERRERVEAAQAARMADVRKWHAVVEQHAIELKQLRTKLGILPPLVRRHAEQIANAAEASAKEFETDARQFLKRGRWMLRGEDQKWKERLSVVESGTNTLRHLLANTDAVAGPCVLYTRAPICDNRLVPRQLPVPADIDNRVSLTATPSEFEPATFAIFACKDLADVVLKASDLRCNGKTIPASAIDLRVVKPWYQNGISNIGFRKGQRVLVPELLLKDDDLIRVDEEAQTNLMRSDDEGNVTYVDISKGDPGAMPDVAPRDAKELQPFQIPCDTLKQIWITAHIPEDAAPGEYEGQIRIHSAGEAVGELSVELRVLPFHLEPPLLVQSMYYGAKLRPNRGRLKMTAHYKNEQQLEAELRNMAEHGLTAPTTYQPYDDNLVTILQLRNRTGLGNGPLFTLGQSTGNTSEPARLKALQASVKKWLNIAREYGYEEVYFYGMDEAKGERLLSQRAAWQAVREAGGKTFVAGYRGSFESVGDVQDLLVFAGPPDSDEAAKYHSIGHQIYNYANPQCGCEQPERYRRNYGLLLWKSNFDGAMDFAYQWEFGHIWNDFDSPKYRDHVMAYPTVDGVVDTLQWEGYREGVDDTRYLATLLRAIENASPDQQPKAAAAQRWLAEFDVNGDLDAIRETMVKFILELR